MLIELWEHVRGYDNWTPATATIQSSTIVGDGFSVSEGGAQPIAWQSACEIAWLDQNHVQHAAVFSAFEESPLYQLCEGDKVSIRFNPNRPDDFYLPGLFHSNLARIWKLSVFAMLGILILIAFAVAWFGPSIMNAFSH